MTTLRGRSRWGWGVIDDAGARLEESPYDARGGIPFALCDVDDVAVAIVGEPLSQERRARLANITLPDWIHAIAYAAQVSAPDAAVGVLDAEAIQPAQFDHRVVAVAGAVTVMSEGMFERYPDRYEVRIAAETITFSMDFDDDAEVWVATFPGP